MATKRTLWERIYFEAACTEASRLIGYAGTTAAAFWDAAKELVEKHGRQKVQNAVYDLTRYDKREAKDPRYEFTAEAKKWMWGILGPAPDHPDYSFIKYGPVLAFKEDVEKWKKEYAARKAAEEAKPPEQPPEAKEPEKPKERPPEPAKEEKPKRARKKAAK